MATKVGRFGPHTVYRTSTETEIGTKMNKAKKTKEVLGTDVDYSPERKIVNAPMEGSNKKGMKDYQLDKPLTFAKANMVRLEESMCDHVIYDHSVERGPTGAELMIDQAKANFKEHLENNVYLRDQFGAA